MGEHSEGSIVFSKRQSKPSKPLTTAHLAPSQHLDLGGNDALLRHCPLEEDGVQPLEYAPRRVALPDLMPARKVSDTATRTAWYW